MPQIGIGEYRVRAGAADVPFWRIVPGTDQPTLTANTMLAHFAPNDPATWNTVTIPPPFGVFDIVIRMSEPVVEQTLTDPGSTGLLVANLRGAPVNSAMPMWEDGSGSADHRVANISFAVPIPVGQTFFEGTLVLTARQAPTANPGVKTVRLPIRVDQFTRTGNLFVFFIATRRARPPGERYCWIRVSTRIWNASAAPPPAAGTQIDAKILRDNVGSFNTRNRRTALIGDAAGVAEFRHANGNRTVLAFPTAWPLIFTATLANHVPRANLARLEQANISHNLTPHQIPALQLIPVATAIPRLAARTVLIDPGHAVVYAFTARRSQEWFVAHRIGTRVRNILRTRFMMPAANLFMTRTAGFGLITPGPMSSASPDTGAARFVFKIAGRQLRIRAALGLHDLSDMALTGDNDDPTTIAEAGRNRLIAINGTTVTAIVTRIQSALPAGQQVQAGSVRWHPATGRYVCRIIRTAPAAGQNPIVDDARRIAVTVNDWFTLDAAMLENLARRTARWSMEHELGSGAPADAASGRPSFGNAIVTAMTGENAAGYFRQKILEELDLEEPYLAGATIPNQYRNKESMGWHFRVRRDYINRKNCDIALTIHENALGQNDAGVWQLGGLGMAMLVGEDEPEAQVRVAKRFMKYTDPFDQGMRQGGVATNSAGQLQAGNTRRAKHVYFELEFMTSTILANPEVRAPNPSRYQYQAMVAQTFADTVAEQIVAGIVEFLLDPQSDIDTATLQSSLPTW